MCPQFKTMQHAMAGRLSWSPLYRAYSRIAVSIRSNELVFQHLFGFPPLPAAQPFGQYWDWTTLALKKLLDRCLDPGMSMLDMGTGAAAVLAIYAARQLHPGAVVAADHVATVVAAAELHTQAYARSVRVVESDLFSNLPGKFDVIVFNAPYLIKDNAKRLGLMATEIDEIRFSGGLDGCTTIARFLTAVPCHLNANGFAALGINHFHLGETEVTRLICECGLKRKARIDLPLSRSSAYMLQC